MFKKLICLVSVVAMLATGALVPASAANDPFDSNTVNVVYFGGSITRGTGASPATERWGTQVNDWLNEYYTNHTFKEINMGIGGTGSDMGVLRLDRDVASQNPDLVFVEFAVNDIGKANAAQNMESIVRGLTSLPKVPYIVFVYTARANAQNGTRVMQNNAAAHSTVAKKYGIPEIDLMPDLKAAIESTGDGLNDETNIKQYLVDFTHPTNMGYDIYTDTIIDALESGACYQKPVVPATKLNQDSFDEVLDIDWVKANASSVKASGSWAGNSTGNTYYGVDFGSNTPGDTLTYEFDGPVVGIQSRLAKTAGQYTVVIDGQTRTSVKVNSTVSSQGVLGYSNFALGGGHHKLQIVVDTYALSDGTNGMVSIDYIMSMSDGQSHNYVTSNNMRYTTGNLLKENTSLSEAAFWTGSMKGARSMSTDAYNTADEKAYFTLTANATGSGNMQMQYKPKTDNADKIPHVSANKPYTFSIWAKANSDDAIGKSLNTYIYRYETTDSEALTPKDQNVMSAKYRQVALKDEAGTGLDTYWKEFKGTFFVAAKTLQYEDLNLYLKEFDVRVSSFDLVSGVSSVQFKDVSFIEENAVHHNGDMSDATGTNGGVLRGWTNNATNQELTLNSSVYTLYSDVPEGSAAKKSLRVANTSAAYHPTAILPNRKYEISFWLKGDSYTDASGAVTTCAAKPANIYVVLGRDKVSRFTGDTWNANKYQYLNGTENLGTTPNWTNDGTWQQYTATYEWDYTGADYELPYMWVIFRDPSSNGTNISKTTYYITDLQINEVVEAPVPEEDAFACSVSMNDWDSFLSAKINYTHTGADVTLVAVMALYGEDGSLVRMYTTNHTVTDKSGSIIVSSAAGDGDDADIYSAKVFVLDGLNSLAPLCEAGFIEYVE